MSREPLVCKICGYKQYDSQTVNAMRKKFKGYATHDIPYYCGACQDMVSDEEYYEMMKEMKCRVSK